MEEIEASNQSLLSRWSISGDEVFCAAAGSSVLHAGYQTVLYYDQPILMDAISTSPLVGSACGAFYLAARGISQATNYIVNATMQPSYKALRNTILATTLATQALITIPVTDFIVGTVDEPDEIHDFINFLETNFE